MSQGPYHEAMLRHIDAINDVVCAHGLWAPKLQERLSHASGLRTHVLLNDGRIFLVTTSWVDGEPVSTTKEISHEPA